jgi:hypothetical protein
VNFVVNFLAEPGTEDKSRGGAAVQCASFAEKYGGG